MSARGKPANEIKTLNQWIKAIKVSNRTHAQRELISRYEVLRSSILNACNIFRRGALEPAEQVDDRELFKKVADASMERLLELVPADRRDKLKARASSTAAKKISNLGHLEFFAHAELKLRSLGHLCVETSSYAWSKEHRLPEWETLINTAKRELHQAVDEWKRIKRRLGR